MGEALSSQIEEKPRKRLVHTSIDRSTRQVCGIQPRCVAKLQWSGQRRISSYSYPNDTKIECLKGTAAVFILLKFRVSLHR